MHLQTWACIIWSMKRRSASLCLLELWATCGSICTLLHNLVHRWNLLERQIQWHANGSNGALLQRQCVASGICFGAFWEPRELGVFHRSCEGEGDWGYASYWTGAIAYSGQWTLLFQGFQSFTIDSAWGISWPTFTGHVRAKILPTYVWPSPPMLFRCSLQQTLCSGEQRGTRFLN